MLPDPMSRSSHVLPARVRFCGKTLQDAVFDGVVPLARMARVLAVSPESSKQSPVAVHLSTQFGPDGGAIIAGEIRGCLCLRCQRCLESMDWRFVISVNLRVVRTETEEHMALQCSDPFLIEDDWLPLHAIAEDEILLAMPMAPRHSVGVCPRLVANS